MAKCRNCNGWGIVLVISTPPPADKDRRIKMLQDDQKARLKSQPGLSTLQMPCNKCLGYGVE